ncbi:hypothetical protein MZC64_23875 [Crossiella sp. S99.2]|nr:hypothetical protein [Crossiella sp. S99.2]MCK2253960.1 hypothetical protein [Crossiella sp. S99.1]
MTRSQTCRNSSFHPTAASSIILTRRSTSRNKPSLQHVEIKVVATMIATGRREVELAINNVPCGIEVQKYWNDVCDKVLARFLPEGFALTVYGTTRDNQPWTKTYTGRRRT